MTSKGYLDTSSAIHPIDHRDAACARGASSLRSEAREEARAAGAERGASDEADGRGRIRPSRPPAAKPRRSRSAERRSYPRWLDLDRIADEEGRDSLLGGGLVEGRDIGLRQVVELREVAVELRAPLRHVLPEEVARRLVVAGKRLVQALQLSLEIGVVVDRVLAEVALQVRVVDPVAQILQLFAEIFRRFENGFVAARAAARLSLVRATASAQVLFQRRDLTLQAVDPVDPFVGRPPLRRDSAALLVGHDDPDRVPARLFLLLSLLDLGLDVVVDRDA